MTRDATIKFQGYIPYPPVDKVDDWGLSVGEQVRMREKRALPQMDGVCLGFKPQQCSVWQRHFTLHGYCCSS